MQFATVSRHRHTDSCERPVHPPKHKCASIQRRAFQNVTMCVSLQRRAQKCMNLSTIVRPASRKQKNEVLLQVWSLDTTLLTRSKVARRHIKFAFRYSFVRSTPFLARRLPESRQNLRFATVLGDRRHVFSERVA